MSEPMSDSPFPTPDRAGLYVLGLLRGDERREFEADMSADPVLASEVSDWEERLLPLALTIPPAEPGRSVWRAIELVVAPPVRPVAVGRERSGWRVWFWDNLLVWRGIGALGAAAAIILAVLLPRPVPGPSMVAVLSAKTGPVFTVAMRADGAMNIASVGHAVPPPGKVWQLWAMAKGEKPMPIGFVQPGHTTLPPHDMPVHMHKPGTMIAVTVEPSGGSPTGLPDTPIVFSGPLLPVGRSTS